MSPAGGGCRPDAARWFAAQSGTKGKTAEANLLIGRGKCWARIEEMRDCHIAGLRCGVLTGFSEYAAAAWHSVF